MKCHLCKKKVPRIKKQMETRNLNKLLNKSYYL